MFQSSSQAKFKKRRTSRFPALFWWGKNWAECLENLFFSLRKVFRFQAHGGVAMAWQDAG